MPRRAVCLAVCLLLGPSYAQADDWPQWLGPRRDGVWREQGIMAKFPPGGPKVRWRQPVGEGYSGPAVADSKVFVTDRVFLKGTFKENDTDPDAARTKGMERILCLDEAKGTPLWHYDYDCPYEIDYAAGPRTTPVVTGGKVYALGA